MQTIRLDASGWLTDLDALKALLVGLGAPEWHGHNLNALFDSLLGEMNAVEPPFAVIVEHAEKAPAGILLFLADIEAVFGDARREFGHDISFMWR